MKDLFRGYYKLTDQEIQNIWDNGFISLDTNVLFNIYRYSEETRKELIRVIRKYSSQLWLTNHSAFEFHKNRISVIAEQINIYDETIKTFNKLEHDIIKNLKTPHLSKAVLQKFERTISETIKDLEKKKEFYRKLLLSDNILSTISTTFNKKVGEAFADEEKLKIEKEGEDRYKRKVPPGFKDIDKSENKYGDLIIWKELVRKAKADKKPFILIIDDLKEDWWLRVQGQTISPRQELAQELYKEAGQTFHLYTPDRFLEFASITEKVKQEAIDEVREIHIENYTPISYSNDLSKRLYNSSALAELVKTNEIFSENLGVGTAFRELKNNVEFMKGLENLKSVGEFSKRWATNPFNSEFYSNLASFKAIADLQNTYNSISNLSSPNPLAEAFLKAKNIEKEKSDNLKAEDIKEDPK